MNDLLFQMNDLIDRFKDKLTILAFPCNQFGHQENGNGEEILKSLKVIRPGDGFVPKARMMSKVDVNGEKADPVFQYLKSCLPFPHDNPEGFIHDPRLILWTPVPLPTPLISIILSYICCIVIIIMCVDR